METFVCCYAVIVLFVSLFADSCQDRMPPKRRLVANAKICDRIVKRIKEADLACAFRKSKIGDGRKTVNVMANENGTWVMHGMDRDDPGCIRSWQELADWIDEVGFLPLFKNEAYGFSVEENTSDLFWWTGDPAEDPWEWRALIARSGRIAYGKFFGGKAGFISKEWFPYFANWRREGYDFDSRWDEELATMRSKRIMDRFTEQTEWFSFALKRDAGFGKDGEKNFDGTVAELQMQTYLVTRDFRQRINKKGLPYGWAISVYATPESLFGYEQVTSQYQTAPEKSKEKIYTRASELFPDATEADLQKVLG